MIRTREHFVSILDSPVRLGDKRVLEIGCGSGHYTKQLAPLCAEVVAIDPDPSAIREAQDSVRFPNVTFGVIPAQNLSDVTGRFQVVIFTLSLHHVPDALMAPAIAEAARVAYWDGFIVFLEPDQEGSFFEAELAFEACDGDEREAKSRAYRAMLEHPRLASVAELSDQTDFRWDSLEDFVDTMHPRGCLSQLGAFLQRHEYSLTAKRRINIFTIRAACP